MALSVVAASAQSTASSQPSYAISKPSDFIGDQPKSEKNGNGDKKDENGNGKKKDNDKEDELTWLSIHGQGTIVLQGNGRFRSPYEGPISLLSKFNYRTTETATLFLAARVWEGGEIVFNPEIAGGVGLSGTMGMGGFPNGEATRVGVPQPTPYFARLLVRQTFGFGGEQEKIEDGPNTIAGYRDVNRLTIAFGKMSATDSLDNNRYSHDPRTQFLNWSLMYNGAWDYPANVRGYTYGITFDLNQEEWAARYGIFAVPTVANGAELDPRFLRGEGHVVELERRYECDDQPGRITFSVYANLAHMGKYRDSLALSPINPDITATRSYRVKFGFGLNWEQKLNEELGVFARLGWNDDQTESWAFTEIGRTAALGLLLKGNRWNRAEDEVGLAVVVNGLSDAHRDYLAAGGLGFIVGDGQLHYGAETILETYYNWQLKKGINLTFDFQLAFNPGYNQDRGPVAIGAVRLHFEY